MMGFGDFSTICSKTPLPICSVIKSSKHYLLTSGETIVNTRLDVIDLGVLPICYARAINLANTVIYEIGNAFVNICALFVVLVIIYNVRRKVTAIGRSEYGYFFQLYFVLLVFTLVVDCGVSTPGSHSYPYLVAVQVGLAGACCWVLSIIGMLGFRLWEDGTIKSMCLVFGMSLAGFLLNFVVSIVSFNEWLERNSDMSTDTIGIFTVMYLLNIITIVIYLVSQLTISTVVIKNFWATGAILLGLFFFVVGQVLLYVFSNQICEGVKHYLDGLFFASVCNLFTIMMLYKTWDMTTDDDLEFSVRVDVNGYTSYETDDKF